MPYYKKGPGRLHTVAAHKSFRVAKQRPCETLNSATAQTPENVYAGFRPFTGWQWGALAFVVVIFFATRLYGITEHSVWYDEFITINYVGLPTLSEALSAQRQWGDWFLVPVYNTVQYYFARWVTPAPAAVRLLSVASSFAGLLLLLAIGRFISGNWAALAACALYSISYSQIYHAVGIRSYAMLEMCSLLAVWLFLLYLARPSVVRLIPFIVACLLPQWTHFMGSLLLVPIGLFMLPLLRTRPRHVLVWLATTGLSSAALYLWMLSGRPDDFLTGSPSKMDFTAWLVDLWQHDSVQFVWSAYAMDLALETAEPSLMQRFSRKATLLYTSSRNGAKAAALIGVLVLLFSRRLREKALNPRMVLAFLLAWWIIPNACIYAAAVLIDEHAFFVRYTIGSLPALYLLMGTGLGSDGWRPLKVTLFAGLFSIFAAQTILAMSVPRQHDYKGIAAFLHQQEDYAPFPVMTMSSNTLLHFNAKDRPLDTEPMDDLEAFCLRMHELANQNGVSFGMFSAGTREHIDALMWTMSEQGLRVTATHFPGGSSMVYVIEAEPLPKGTDAPQEAPS